MLPISLWPTFLIFSTLSCLFHLLQHKDFATLLPLFDVVVSSYVLHAQNSTSNTSIVVVCGRTKTMAEMTNPSNYNPSILVICILKVIKPLNLIDINGPYSLFVSASYFISCSVHARLASVIFID